MPVVLEEVRKQPNGRAHAQRGLGARAELRQASTPQQRAPHLCKRGERRAVLLGGGLLQAVQRLGGEDVQQVEVDQLEL